MTIDEKIKELEEQIEELKRQKETLVTKRWRADRDELYYLVDSFGVIRHDKDEYKPVDDDRYNMGNYFRTELQADIYKQNLITYQQLKDIALRLNNGQEIYWDNGSQDKYYIYFDYIENEFGLTFANSMRSPSVIYCLDVNFLNVALDEIGAERLKQLLESRYE